ncbi:hypothetical protein HID58_076225 [Brassica napus]|uniref:Uncharacterized protein n=1 Tax=Brassica napus TaxID=3708 RepID=A0ABQ7YPJ0_BRANA|nr:hypothetical protein HID58_076225 [Brassica napus]
MGKDMEKLRQALKTLSESEKTVEVSTINYAPDQRYWFRLVLVTTLHLDLRVRFGKKKRRLFLNCVCLMMIITFWVFASSYGGVIDHILRAFEAVLGSPVTLAIRIESKKDLKNVGSSSSRARSKDWKRARKQSIVRGKASLGQVIKQAEGNGWSKRKAMLIADKLEHENLRLEPSSRSLICIEIEEGEEEKGTTTFVVEDCHVWEKFINGIPF